MQIKKYIEQKPGGTTGIVWRAIDDLDREVAVKFFNEPITDIRDAVTRQAHALAKIDHENVVRILGIEDLLRPNAPDDGKPEAALIMQYADGQKFSDWLTKPGLARAEVQQVVDDILSGLAAFHLKNLSHGDLHGGNILVFNGRAKLIDPLAHDPKTALSSAAFREGRRRDLYLVRPMLLDALVAADANTQELGEFGVLSTAEVTVELLREHARLCLREKLAVNSSHPVPALRSFYAHCREAQRTNDVVHWQEMRKSTLRMLQPQLDQWRASHPHLSKDPKIYTPVIADCLNSLNDFLSLLLAAAEYGQNPFSYDIRLVRRLLALEWPKSGATHYVSLPEGLFYCFHRFIGGAAITSGNVAVAAKLARINCRSTLNSTGPLWSCQRLTGWPQLFGGHCIESFEFVSKCYGLLPALRNVFDSDQTFKTSQGAYDVLLGAVELVNKPIQELQKAKSEDRAAYRPTVFPSFMWRSPDELWEIWEMLFGEQAGRDAILQSGNFSEAELDEYWPTMITAFISAWQEQRPWGFELPKFLTEPPPRFAV